ncbi:MAG: DUF2095 family protein [Candidatus Ranarchaeia archaeon]|jgi:hypothetical protein
MDRKEIKKKFPNLSKELAGKKAVVPIKGVRITEGKESPEEKSTSPKETATSDFAPGRIFSGYDPGAIDFIRRCKRKEEALEIIDYLEEKNQITKSAADKFRKQLDEHGLRSFGDPKQWGHYEKTNRSHRP